MEARRWFEHFDLDFRLPLERAQALRVLLKRSIECAPQQGEAYELLAWVEASVVEPDISNVGFVQRHIDSVRQKARTLLALAVVKVRLEERKAALELLDQVDRLQTDFWVASAAEILRAKLENRAPRVIPQPVAGSPLRQRLRVPLPRFAE